MANKTKQRGYFKLSTEDGDRWMHFSMNFLLNLEDLTEQTTTEWGTELKKLEGIQQVSALCDAVFCAMIAYSQENDEEVNYNIYAVRDWVAEAAQKDPKIISEMAEVLTASFGVTKEDVEKAGKQVGKSKKK